MEYNENIRLQRKNLGLTQQQLADELGVTRQMVTRWENGWNVPSLFYAQKMAARFGTSVTELMTGEAEPAPAAAKETRDILGRTVFVCILSFLPTALFYLFSALTEGVRQYLFLQGFTSALEYRAVTDVLDAAGGAACALAYAVLFGYWIAAFFGLVRAPQDKYLRYRLYRQWTAGLLFLLAQGFVLFLLIGVPELSFPLSPLPEYVGAALFAAFFGLLFDILFKKFARRFMVAERNPRIERLNIGFLIAAGAVIAATLVLVLYVGAAGGSAAPAAGWLILAGYFALSLLLCALYFILRACAARRTPDEPKDRTKPQTPPSAG